ncbi:MAG: MBL fold metallo-hydrolase [Azospirillum sp.]|nr:MBL fold metallo-hydrolase [Azospirillum sp.]
MAFSLTFWGVRGTIPCPAASHMGYGGNTSCVEIIAGDQRIILDAGTGIRLLGRRMIARGAKRATLLLSHTHLDHISGFPFFAPAFQPGFDLRIIAGHLGGSPDIQSVMARQMERPLFPVPLKTMGCNLRFEEISQGASFDLDPEVRVRTAPLNHPDGATGYRIDYGGKSIAYITDTEHFRSGPDANILTLIENADLVMYDSTYTDEEYETKIGWGHSTWREGIRLAQLARARCLALFHHEPDHDDATMAMIEGEARSLWPPVFAARESTTIDLL